VLPEEAVSTRIHGTRRKVAKAIALGAGTHTVIVTDENGCTAEGSVVITENILPLAVSIKQGEKIVCAGQSNASLEAMVTGGKSPYAIIWKGPANEWKGEKVTGLMAGQYALQVLDANGSSATSSFEVTAPKPLTVTAEEISPANTGSADGSVTLKATGGTGNYSVEGHTWSSGANHKIEELKPGTYLCCKRCSRLYSECKCDDHRRYLTTYGLDQTNRKYSLPRHSIR
jgi:hypothetical protein